MRRAGTFGHGLTVLRRPPSATTNGDLQERPFVARPVYVSSPARMKYCSMAVFEGERG